MSLQGEGMDGGCMPLPTRPQRYRGPASLVIAHNIIVKWSLIVVFAVISIGGIAGVGVVVIVVSDSMHTNFSPLVVVLTLSILPSCCRIRTHNRKAKRSLCFSNKERQTLV